MRVVQYQLVSPNIKASSIAQPHNNYRCLISRNKNTLATSMKFSKQTGHIETQPESICLSYPKCPSLLRGPYDQYMKILGYNPSVSLPCVHTQHLPTIVIVCLVLYSFVLWFYEPLPLGVVWMLVSLRPNCIGISLLVGNKFIKISQNIKEYSALRLLTEEVLQSKLDALVRLQ